MKSQDPNKEHLQSIINLYNKGLLQQALSESSQMLERFPNSVILYNIAGASNAALMQFDAAIESYKQALRIKPDYADAYYNMGVALNDKGDPEAAIESYKQALRIKPDYAEGHSNLGTAFQLLNQIEQAVASYEKAISLKKDLNTAISGLGKALLKKGEHSVGLDKLRQGEGSILFNIKSGLSIK